MIVLINPMLSNYRNVNGDSCYIVIKYIVEEIIKQDPTVQFLIMFPRDKNFKYFDDGFFSNSQIRKIPIDLPYRKMDSVVHFNVNYWRKVFSTFTPDIIWNHVPEIGHLFLNMYTSFDTEKTQPAVFNQHHYVIHPTLPYPTAPYRQVQFQSMGAFMCNLNLFNSLYCKKMFDDVDLVKQPLNYEILPFAFIDNENYPKPNVEDNGKIRIAYNHRLQDYKNYLETFEMLDQLYTTHKNFEVLVTNPNGANFNKLKNYPFVVGKNIAKHEDYLKELSTCHLNITNTQHETFCISALESLAFGQILVAPNAMTFPELVPEGYEYLFNSEEEQYKMLDNLFSNPKIFAEKREGIRKATHDKFNRTKIGNRYRELFDKYSEYRFDESNLKDTSKKAIEWVRKTNKGKFVTLGEIQNQFSKFNLGRQAFPLLKIKRVFNKMGYSDTIKGLEQGFQF